MLEVRQLSAGYGLGQVLWSLDLSVKAGDAVAILGRNGAGKTTFLRTLMGLHPVMKGSIVLDGQDITRVPAHRRARMGLSYVPQGRGIFPFLTVEENLSMGAAGRGQRAASASKIPAIVFDLFPALHALLPKKGGDLSGGQQQQLAIGRALAMAPRLLLLDEPTEGIQPSIVEEIEEALITLRTEGTGLSDESEGQKGVAIILVEQRLDFAWRFTDRFYLMQKGSIIEQGGTQERDKGVVQELISV